MSQENNQEDSQAARTAVICKQIRERNLKGQSKAKTTMEMAEEAGMVRNGKPRK